MKRWLIILLLLAQSFVLADDYSWINPSLEIDQTNLINVVLDGNLVKKDSRFTEFTVHLQTYNNQGKRLGKCTGILIANDIVLTAGHCFGVENINIEVKFGLGGEAGYTHILKTNIYRAINQNTKEKESKSKKWVDGKMKFDLKHQQRFYRITAKRKDFKNYAYEGSKVEDIFLNDYAIVRIPFLPTGYKPISLYQGSLSFLQKVFIIGYGLNSREKVKNTYSL